MFKDRSNDYVFLKIFRKSPPDFLLKALPSLLSKNDKPRPFVGLTDNKQRNLIHALIMNKKLSHGNLIEILKEIFAIFSHVELMLLQYDKDYMIPLTLFFYERKKLYKKNSESIPLAIIKYLAPKNISSIGLNIKQANIDAYKLFEIHHILSSTIKKIVNEMFAKSSELFINVASYNTNILRAAISYGSENLLFSLLEEIPTLDLNRFCFYPGIQAFQKRHLLKELVAAGFSKVIEFFFKRFTRDIGFVPIEINIDDITILAAP
jgi:hypothetical protein